MVQIIALVRNVTFGLWKIVISIKYDEIAKEMPTEYNRNT